MATDYDAPRRTETDDVSEDSLEELKARRNEAASAVVDVDESESAESFELPGADTVIFIEIQFVFGLSKTPIQRSI